MNVRTNIKRLDIAHNVDSENANFDAIFISLNETKWLGEKNSFMLLFSRLARETRIPKLPIKVVIIDKPKIFDSFRLGGFRKESEGSIVIKVIISALINKIAIVEKIVITVMFIIGRDLD